jgi:hypothetical protein
MITDLEKPSTYISGVISIPVSKDQAQHVSYNYNLGFRV